MDNAIQVIGEKNITIGKFTLAKTGLVINGDPNYSEWEDCGKFLKQAEKAVQFWIGDWLNYGEKHYGETYTQAIDVTGQEYGTLANEKYVSSHVETSLRSENLSFGHHKEVAPLIPEEQKYWLDKAEEEHLSVADLRHAIKRNQITEAAKIPSSKYRIIYADPPWKYGNNMPDYFSEQADHYDLMDIGDICSLPIKDISEDNAVLFLWATSPILEESFEVITAWGFEYKSSFIWDKVKHVMGHYNSVRHEFLLVCIKGSCQPDVQKLFDSVITEERTEHSRKPKVFREIIDTIYPHGKRIELFAREKAEGWDVYGNESIS